MREIICAHIGQAGVQLSSTIWELFCTEHGIQADGNLLPTHDENYTFQAFFQEIPTGQFVPRAISVDLEPTVLDEIRNGPYRKLFHPDQLISGCEDAANNFARGHFTLGKEQIDYAINRIRKVVDMCDSLQGFFVFHSFGGGTGSGFSALLLERLNVEFTKKSTFQVGVYPGERLASAAVEPYNTMLCSTFTIDHADLTNIFDNESVYSICSNKLDIPRPSFSNLNRLISQIISSMTVSVRFEGYLNAELDQMVTNLVPYPRIHFPVFTHSPLISVARANHQAMTTIELTRDAFDPTNQLVACQLEEGKFISCCLQYRGKVTPREVNDALFEIKRRTDVKFVDWCPTGFKLGLNNQPPAYVPRSEIAPTERSLTMLANTTSISQRFLSLLNRADILFRKRCFMHWYVSEGMEEAEMLDSRDEMSNIIMDYGELVGEEEAPAEPPSTAPPPEKPATTEPVTTTEAEGEGGAEEAEELIAASSGAHESTDDAKKDDDKDDDDKDEDSESESESKTHIDKDDDDEDEE